MGRQLRLRRHTLEVGARTLVMGVLNVTPDSFSGNGVYQDPEKAVSRALTMIREGADIIDVGGESTRPGAQPVTAEEELRRILPVVEKLVDAGMPLSIDTYKPETAEAALEAGADMINDVTGLRNPRIIDLVGKYQAGSVIMHGRSEQRAVEDNLVNEPGITDQVRSFFEKQINALRNAGLPDDTIVIDPGIGFGKTQAQNLELIHNLAVFKDLGTPIMVGPSRKGFIGKILDLPMDQRLEGTIATVVASVLNGANIVRVHDVKECSRAVKMADAIVRRPVQTEKIVN
jgi:dihydropteroate synthase